VREYLLIYWPLGVIVRFGSCLSFCLGDSLAGMIDAGESGANDRFDRSRSRRPKQRLMRHVIGQFGDTAEALAIAK
jgi:hypothetical protein